MNHHRGEPFRSSSSNINNNMGTTVSGNKIFVLLLQVVLVVVLVVDSGSTTTVAASATTQPPTRHSWTSSSSSSSSPFCPFTMHSSCNNKNVVPFNLRRLLLAARGGATTANDDSVSNGSGGDDEQEFFDAVQEEGGGEEEMNDDGDSKNEAETNKEETPRGSDDNDDDATIVPAKEEEEDEDDSGMKWDAGEVNVPGDDTSTAVTEEEDSSANVDKMDYADAYDDEEDDDGRETSTSTTATTGGFSETNDGSTDGSVAWTETVAAVDDDEEESSSFALDDNDNSSKGNQHNNMISLASEITNDMKKVLMQELAYRRVDVEAMRPEIAAMVIAKKIRKPMEGLPSNWFVDENSAAAWRSKRQAHTLLGRFGPQIIALVLGAFIVSEKTNLFDIMKLDHLPSMRNIFPSRQKATLSLPVFETIGDDDLEEEAETGQQGMLLGESNNIEDSMTLSGATATTASVDGGIVHEHSVRPGEKPSPEPIDETGLDRGLTVIMKKLSAIFQKKL